MPSLSRHHQQRDRLVVAKDVMDPLSPAKARKSKRQRYPLLMSTIRVTTSRKRSTTSAQKVAFSNVLKVGLTIHITDYTPEERLATWYNAREIMSFKADRKDTARRIEEGKTTETDRYRGLESLTPMEAHLRHERILVGINSVLDEQELQDLDGKENLEMIAHIYMMATQASKVLARERGISNELEVKLFEEQAMAIEVSA